MDSFVNAKWETFNNSEDIWIEQNPDQAINKEQRQIESDKLSDYIEEILQTEPNKEYSN